MSTWDSHIPPPDMGLTPRQRARAMLRFALLALGLVPALLALGLARAAETVIHSGARRFTPRVVQGYCRFLLWVIGLRSDCRGTVMAGDGALVANHASWLDIFVLNARAPVQFVAKAEVAGWPGIGLLARLAGTVFIRRDRRDATAQTRLLAAEFRRGHRLVFFPEGTSTDSTLVLPFKATLFQAFLAPDMPRDMAVQPVSLRYHAPDGADPRFYGWWGGMDFARHFLRVLGQARQGHVTVLCHAPIFCTPGTTRKALALQAEAAVQTGFNAG
ncbi:MAG: lyso-ornithine lipid acyltransferase [Roseibaca calidilacus]|uniref:Lyso-ornithine lipid acyltransferase n=1 Tax=Roseibaca calidilacus TaxID=1666912 RepID=A0A0P7WAC5_9RHOB|nr:lysophospholipid acyltransferase family protein [Roseibaca calidilacus]KPP94501.1 MAG: lyso-ornithine lipid acyltransferase [Roseibaca calidilacus]CUX83133.1 lyso-ornithine lipid acyltransferase [Roseibaca calidilacus]